MRTSEEQCMLDVQEVKPAVVRTVKRTVNTLVGGG